jgi:hypothetical protein
MRHNEFIENVKMFGIVAFVLGVALLLFLFLIFNAAMASTLII